MSAMPAFDPLDSLAHAIRHAHLYAEMVSAFVQMPAPRDRGHFVRIKAYLMPADCLDAARQFVTAGAVYVALFPGTGRDFWSWSPS